VWGPGTGDACLWVTIRQKKHGRWIIRQRKHGRWIIRQRKHGRWIIRQRKHGRWIIRQQKHGRVWIGGADVAVDIIRVEIAKVLAEMACPVLFI
jgi:hypothetical protein